MFFLMQNQRDSDHYDVVTKTTKGTDYVWGSVHCDLVYDADLNTNGGPDDVIEVHTHHNTLAIKELDDILELMEEISDYANEDNFQEYIDRVSKIVKSVI